MLVRSAGRLAALYGLSSWVLLAGCKPASFKAAGTPNDHLASGASAGSGEGDGTAATTTPSPAAPSPASTDASPAAPSATPGSASTDIGVANGCCTTPAASPSIAANGSTTGVSVAPGDTVAITWSAPGATTCLVTPLSASGTSGSQSVQAVATQAYTLQCQTPNGPTTNAVTVTVVPPPAPTVAITANGASAQTTANPGDNVAIAWTSSNADTCLITPGALAGVSGSTTAAMAAAPLLYSASCTGKGGTTTAAVVVNPAAQPGLTAQLQANGSAASVSIPYNTPVTLSWTSSGATSCNLSPLNDTRLNAASLATAPLTVSTLYYLTCTNGLASTVSALTVNVGLMPPPLPDLKINGSDGPLVAASGTPLAITWSNATGVGSCTLTPPQAGANNASSGGATGAVSAVASNTPVTYTLTCSNAGGQGVDTVSVLPQVTPPTATLTADNQAGGVITVAANAIVKLAWSSTAATTCAVSPGNYSGLSGTQQVGPVTSTVVVSLMCVGPFGTAASTVVLVPASPKVATTLTVNGSRQPVTVAAGSLLTVAWGSSQAANCRVAPFGFTGLAGSATTTAVTTNQTVTLTCADASGNQSTSSVAVTVVPNTSNATIILLANGNTIPVNILTSSPSVQLVWSSVGTVACSFDDGVKVTTYGSSTHSVSSDTRFTITCTTTSGGTISASAQVYVKNSCVRSTKVGINFSNYPASSGAQTFNDFTACTDQGDFSIYGSQIVSERCQTVPFTTSKKGTCSHHVRVEVHHPNGSQEPPVEFDDTLGPASLMLHFFKGSVLQVNVTPLASCGYGNQASHSMQDPAWAIVKGDECRRCSQ